MVRNEASAWAQAYPARPMAAACSPPRSRAISAVAMAAVSPEGTSRPLMPWRTISRLPPTSVATIGSDDAHASSKATEYPSLVDVRAKTSMPVSKRGTSWRSPMKRSASDSPACSAWASSAARRGPSPTITSAASGTCTLTFANARSSRAWSFTGCSRPTVPMMRLPVGNPNSATSDWRATSSAGRKRSRRMPLGTDSNARRGRIPSAAKRWRAASHTATA